MRGEGRGGAGAISRNNRFAIEVLGDPASNQEGRHTVHNLTIADIHTYYVLAGVKPVLVHNRGGCKEDSYAIEDHVVPRHTRNGDQVNGAKSLFDAGWISVRCNGKCGGKLDTIRGRPVEFDTL